jgi:hypothetical protein
MPLMHCMNCIYEWESTSEKSLCAQCGAAGYVLREDSVTEKKTEDEDEEEDDQAVKMMVKFHKQFMDWLSKTEKKNKVRWSRCKRK